MGSTNFGDTIYTTKSLTDAYREMVADAVDMDGHDPYNGTISTTNGVHLHNTSGPVLLQEAMRISEGRLQHLQKWENAEAIQIVDESKFPVRKQTKKIKVTAQDIKDADGSPMKAISLVARANATLRANEVVTDVEVARNTDNFTYMVTPKYRVTTKATEGKTETRYLISDGHNTTPWEKGYKSMAEARKRMVEIASATPSTNFLHGFGGVDTEYSVISVTKREGGLPLVRTTREIVSLEATVNLVFTKVTPNAPAAGFYIYGWAAC